MLSRVLLLCVSFVACVPGSDLDYGFTGDGEFKKYDDAYREATEKNLPLLVLVGASWCPPCQVLKKNLIALRDEKVTGADGREARVSELVVITLVDVDEDPVKAETLRGTDETGAPNRPPRLVRFSRNAAGVWGKASTGNLSREAPKDPSKDPLKEFVLLGTLESLKQ